MRKKKKNVIENKELKKQEIEIEFIKEIIGKIKKICSRIRRSTNASAFVKQQQIDAGTEEGDCLRFKIGMEVR